MGCVCSRRRRAIDYSKASHHRLFNSGDADDISLSSQLSGTEAPIARSAAAAAEGAEPTNTVELKRSDSLENLLTCLICLDYIFEPVTADCGHSFCKSCLKRLLEYEGSVTPCPKCRQPLNLDAAKLQVDRRLKRAVRTYAPPGATIEREQQVAQEDAEYREARAEREEHERMMDENPLQLMFDNETDPARRAVLERDVSMMETMGFSAVQAQKALFLWAGVYHEAVNWLVTQQYAPDIEMPWNMTQLQLQTLIRNTRRSLLSTLTPYHVHHVIPGRLRVYCSSMGLSGTEGRPCFCYVTSGFHTLGHSEIVVLLLKEDEEQIPPVDVIKFLAHLFDEVLHGGLVLTEHSSVRFSSTTPFLGDPFNAGMIFASYAGQILSGLPLPPAPFLFGLLLRGDEMDWARSFPARLLVFLGYQYPAEPPYPLWSNRFRAAVTAPNILPILAPLRYGLQMPGTTIVRTRSGLDGCIRVLIPREAQQAAVQFVERNRHAKAITIFGGLARGADTFLVYVGSLRGAASLSINNSEGNAVCATQVVLVEKRQDGGTVEGDVFVMGLCTASMSRVLHSLSRAESCEIPAARRGVRLSLRIEFHSRAVIDSGVAHNDSLLPHALAIAAACVPRGSTTASLPPFLCRHVDLVDLHPRINVLGVTIVTPRHLIQRRCDPGQLDVYICSLIMAVNKLLVHHLVDVPGQPSSIILHVDLRASRDVRFRITKDWADVLPQAPAVTMLMWRMALHGVNTPSLHSTPPIAQTSLIDPAPVPAAAAATAAHATSADVRAADGTHTAADESIATPSAGHLAPPLPSSRGPSAPQSRTSSAPPSAPPSPVVSPAISFHITFQVL